MKKVFIASLIVTIISCSSTVSTTEKFVTSNIPAGISLYGFNEKYNAYKGEYSVDFFVKNETGKKMKLPIFRSAFYVDGKNVGEPVGGVARELAKGDSGVATVSWILPEKKADSVIFYYDGQ